MTRSPPHGRLRWAIAPLVALLVALAPQPAQAAGRCGSHPWCDMSLSPDARAGLLLSVLTQDEKVSLLGGVDPTRITGGAHTHTGASNGVPRVDLPPVYYSDGPVGPRQGSSTAMPVPLALAATFDPSLAYLHGSVVANEVRSKGNDVVFAPTVNIMRTPLGGRTYEAYGEDPFLNSRLTVGWIDGAQSQGVIGDVKHFAANNQEGQDPTGQLGQPGLPLGAGALGARYVSNSIVDERTLREIYLPQFEAAVKEAHVGTVMCSYNELGGTYACENPHLLEQILRKEWGFPGYVVADYGAAHNTIASLNNGLDFEPWPGVAYSPNAVDAALLSGQVSSAQLDNHVRLILRTLFAFGFFDRAAYVDDDNQIDKAAHARVAQHIEESAITLLQNRGALPLNASRLRSVAVIGKAATTFVTGGGSGAVTPFSFADPLSAIKARVGPGVNVTYDDGSNAAQAATDARNASVAIVIGNDYYTEGADRQCLTLECPMTNGNQDALISAVAAAQPNTVVVLETGGPDLTPWRSQVNALLEAWYPGEQGGPALARVLFGDVDPGGRLPVTFPDSESQLPTAGDMAKYPGVGMDVTYKEGVLVGYRWYDANRLAPAFPFGFGLSYSTFGYSGLRVAPGPVGSTAATVSVAVRNTGARTGIEVPQLYLALPSPAPGVLQPPDQLKGFQKLTLAPGHSARASFALDSRSFSYWNVAAGAWRVAPGCYGVLVGRSSRNIMERATIAVEGASCPGAVASIPSGRSAPTRKAARCASRRSILIHLYLLRVRGSDVRRIAVSINGRRRRVLLGPRSAVLVSLTGRPRQVARVRLGITLRSGRTITVVRIFHPCLRTTAHL